MSLSFGLKMQKLILTTGIKVVTKFTYIRQFSFLFLLFLLVVFKSYDYATAPDYAWRFAHWLFNYDYEFLKRALVGTLLKIFDENVSYSFVLKLWTINAVIVAVALFALFTALLIYSRYKTGIYLYSILMISSSATIGHFVFEMGRLDLINLILYMLGLLISFHLKNMISLVFLVPLSMFMIMIHEASFLIYIPSLLAFSFYFIQTNTHKKTNIYLIFALTFLFLTIWMFLVSLAGKASTWDIYEYIQFYYLKGYEGVFLETSFNVLDRGLIDNMMHTYENGVSFRRFAQHIAFIFWFMPLVILFYGLTFEYLKFQKNKLLLILVLSCFTSLALYPLGHDHFRWWSLAITNFFIVISFLMLADKRIMRVISLQMYKKRNIVLLSVLVSLFLGPIGAYEVFPTFKNVIFLYEGLAENL